MRLEGISTLAIVCFVLAESTWAARQPAILNQCHIPLWYLITCAFRNCFLVEKHATMAWTFSALGSVYTSAVH